MEAKGAVLNVLAQSIYLTLLHLSCSLEPSYKDRGNEPPVPPVDAPQPNTADRLEPFLAEWVELNGPISSTITITDIPENGVLGICYKLVNAGQKITHIDIDGPSFDREFEAGTITPKVIVFHELGHCELDRDHLGDFGYYYEQRIPFSLMFPSLWPDAEIYDALFYDHYIDELFGGAGVLRRAKWISTTRKQTIINGPLTVTIIIN